MTQSFAKRVQSILNAALQMDPDQRSLFVRQACAGQEELRLQVEQGLREAANPQPTVDTAFPESPLRDFGYQPGHRLLHYEIVAPLGHGGMGVVFRARDSRLLRDVALKILMPMPGDDPDRRRRFVREAQAASKLNHPNIVTIYDVAEQDGVQFIAMELVEGRTLASALPLEREGALNYATQILNALVKAHAAGIVHRDLKPANIMLTEDGIAKVLDFGLAKHASDPVTGVQTVSELSHTGSIMGTPSYMSPEQTEAAPVDARSDIFSFGAVLYEMLTGARAFNGGSAVAILASVLRDEPRPIRELVPGIWPELENVVARCLRKDRLLRYQSAAEALRELELARKQRSAAARMTVPTMAVLPFANMTGEKENEYFSEGLAEEIINALSKLPGLKVTARTSAFAFKNKAASIQQVAASLGVGHVLEGGVRRAGSRIRVTAQLIQGSDGSHVWSERYDRQMEDIFAIQDEISQSIVEALKVNLIRSEPIVRRSTVNMDAYQAYLEGRYHLTQFAADSMQRAFTCLNRAIELDPGYALPHATLAEYYYYQVGLYGRRPHEYMPKALACAERALELDPNTAEAYIARAMVRTIYTFDWARAAEDFARGLDLNPSSASARYRLAYLYLRPLGRHEEAQAENDRALELDPLSVLIRFGAANLSLMLEQYEKAIKQTRAALELFPNSWIGCWIGGQVFSYVGLFDEAEEALRRGLAMLPDNVLLLGTMATLRNYQGRTAEADEIRARLDAMAKERYVSPCAIYVAHIHVQNVDEAFRRLSYAIEERDPFAASIMFNFARTFGDHPHFQTLRRMMNLPG